MFGRRRDIPPYEIMRPGGREARQRPASAWRSPRPAEDEPPADAFESWTDWLTGGEPVVLRLPKGVALLIAAGVLLLILVAYWVGHARGGAAADARHRQQLDSQVGTRVTVPVPVIVEQNTGPKNPPNDAAPAGSPRDPRVPGLNYLLLAWYPEEEARRLASFLSQRGVETFITTSNNARLFYVVGSQGFERTGSGPARTYEGELRRLGREWKAHNGGRGEDLSTMWWKKHE